MWKKIRLFLPSIAAWVIAGGLQLSGVEIPSLGFSLIGLGVLLLVIPLYLWLKDRRKEDLVKEEIEPTIAAGGLVGRANNVRIKDSHYEGKITVQGKPEEVDAGGLIGRSKNAEVVDSSADAEIEYKQNER